MATFFLVVEVLSYILLTYIFIQKKELAILYLPAFMFGLAFSDSVLSASVYYGFVSVLLLYCIFQNAYFFRNNLFSLIIIIYFALLIPRSSDLEEIRPYLFSVFWLFISIPLIAEMYRKFSKDILFNEVSNAAVAVLVLFILNVVFSTIHKYAPTDMYGITSGILYGQLYATDFNILSTATFLVTLKFLKTRKAVLLVILIVALAFLMLSMRRSVMTTSLLGVGFALLTLLTQREAKKFFLIGSMIVLVGYIIYSSTSFMDQFNERYALRSLDDRALEEEDRFMEYNLLYKDMFVYNDYSPWFGYELFSSQGNYGRGVFEMRSLHADLANIAHSSGIIGVLLYLLMMLTWFFKSFRSIDTATDKLIFAFCTIVFILFTITGRYTQLDSMLLLFSTLLLPLANNNENNEDVLELEAIDTQELSLSR